MDANPLYVDLDGTLIKTDLLYESLLGLLKRNPFLLFLVPVWLWRGRAYLKRMISERVQLDIATLPYSESFLEFLKSEAAAGRRLVLATASDDSYARQVAENLGIFAATIASDGVNNLSGMRKLQAIEADSAGEPFVYAGNALKDVPIWANAIGAIVVNPNPGVAKVAKSKTTVLRTFQDRVTGFPRYVAALRPHQWGKNLLLLVALLVSHRFMEPGALIQVLVGIVAFSIIASSVYILNDLLDLAADRRHPRKRVRPFAAGDIPISHGIIGVAILVVLGLSLSVTLSVEFLCVLLLYLAITLMYSFRLKHYVLIDVLILAALFTIRVFAGAVIIGVFPSFWLLAFCIFLFTSLALVKRCSELGTVVKQGDSSAHGRDYQLSDMASLTGMGIASAYQSVLVIALYINSEEVATLYSRPKALWLLCPVLLYWVSRLWLKTSRGEMHDDPLVFAFKDRGTRYITIVAVMILMVAI